ncbi:MAG: efflux RND transporter periplasmic adaptor subunit [Deltaproteobacteria bacterium]|nr:efflux RND transporter periplasmic adaptor subunit [Deltaproteobacteria bacterium]
MMRGGHWVLVVASFFDLVCARQPSAPPVEPPPPGEVWLSDAQVREAKLRVEPLAEQEVDDVIVTSGRLTFDDGHVAHVFSPVSGRVVAIAAQVGQRVKKGDVLARIESPDVGLASAELSKAQVEEVTAEHDLERQRELFAGHATSQRDLEHADDAARKARAEVVRARQKVLLLRGGGGEAVSQSFVLRAPIDGEVIARGVSPGVEVQGQYGGTAVELFTVGELDRLWVMGDVYEIDVPRVKIGSKVSIGLLAMPSRPIDARVEWISSTLDPSTRTAKIRASVDNRARALKPEMYATVSVSVDERRALAIPRAALLRLGDQTAVFVEKGRSMDGRHVFARTPVTVDEAEGDRWLPILAGLERGAPVVTKGAILLAGDR